MTNLTEVLRTAKRSSNWSVKRFAQLGESAAKQVSGVWDWDEGAGEDWGRVVEAGGDVVMFLWRHGPFAFVDQAAASSLLHYLRSEDVTAEATADFDVCAFSLDVGEFAALFDRDVPDGIELARLSANEIWWASV